MAKDDKQYQGYLVSERVNLIDLRLIKSNCELAPEAVDVMFAYDINYKARYEISAYDESNLLLVFTDFTFEGFRQGDQQKRKLLNIKSTFLLAYEIKSTKGLTDNGYKEFSNVNAIFNAWPFWREFVHNTISKMNLASLTLPSFKVKFEKSEKQAKEDNDIVAKKKSVKKTKKNVAKPQS